MSEESAQKKSGLKILKAGEVLFNDGDPASSLFIIQKGQIRLYKPKGKGFVEIGVIRASEVIGEMAYFDKDGSGKTRSCSAAALSDTEVIEISFGAFGKTLNALNPWFKTIINTLAARLRKTNEQVKQLESNNVSHGFGGEESEYQFFRAVDVVKVLSVLFLVMRALSEKNEQGIAYIHNNTIRFYALDIFNVQESRFEEFMALLKEQEIISVSLDKDKLPKIIEIKDLEQIRAQLIFFNSQRIAAEDKKYVISEKCEDFLEKILEQLAAENKTGDKETVDLSKILGEYSFRNIHISDDDLVDARKFGLLGETVVGEGNSLSAEVNLAELNKKMVSIRLMNAITKINKQKAG